MLAESRRPPDTTTVSRSSRLALSIGWVVWSGSTHLHEAPHWRSVHRTPNRGGLPVGPLLSTLAALCDDVEAASLATLECNRVHASFSNSRDCNLGDPGLTVQLICISGDVSNRESKRGHIIGIETVAAAAVGDTKRNIRRSQQMAGLEQGRRAVNKNEERGR